MNRTTFNTDIPRCGNSLYSINPANISSDFRAVLIVRIVVNSLTCPLIILLNILVMVAVKTKLQLRTKSNIALACLSTTDLVVGVVHFSEVTSCSVVKQTYQTLQPHLYVY